MNRFRVDTEPADGSEALGAVHRLIAPDGSEAKIAEFGATLLQVSVPEPDGGRVRLLLEPGDPAAALEAGVMPAFLGVTVGRTAGRIREGRLRIDGCEARLTPNEGPHHLHGGPGGLHARRWRTVASGADAHGAWVALQIVSPDGDQGYPGTLMAAVRYAWRAGHLLEIVHQGVADTRTPFAPAPHAYWNLTGEGNADVREHRLRIAACRIAASDGARVPTGATAPVGGSGLDLRRARPLSAIPDRPHPAGPAGGLDHGFLLDGGRFAGMRPVAWLSDPVSGRSLEVASDAAFLQAYGGGGLDGSVVGPSGRPYGPAAGIALEPQPLPPALDPRRTLLQPGVPVTIRHAFRVTGPG